MSRSGRTAIPIAGLPGLDIRASTQITAGTTTNHVGAIGVKRRSDAGRNRDVSGPARAVCVSMNPKDELVLDSIAAHHGVTRSGALRAALAYYAAAMKISLVLIALSACGTDPAPLPTCSEIGAPSTLFCTEGSVCVWNGTECQYIAVDAGVDAPNKCGRNPAQDTTCTSSRSRPLDYACADGSNPADSLPGLSCEFQPSDLSYCCGPTP